MDNIDNIINAFIKADGKQSVKEFIDQYAQSDLFDEKYMQQEPIEFCDYSDYTLSDVIPTINKKTNKIVFFSLYSAAYGNISRTGKSYNLRLNLMQNGRPLATDFKILEKICEHVLDYPENPENNDLKELKKAINSSKIIPANSQIPFYIVQNIKLYIDLVSTNDAYTANSFSKTLELFRQYTYFRLQQYLLSQSDDIQDLLKQIKIAGSNDNIFTIVENVRGGACMSMNAKTLAKIVTLLYPESCKNIFLNKLFQKKVTAEYTFPAAIEGYRKLVNYQQKNILQPFSEHTYKVRKLFQFFMYYALTINRFSLYNGNWIELLSCLIASAVANEFRDSNVYLEDPEDPSLNETIDVMTMCDIEHPFQWFHFLGVNSSKNNPSVVRHIFHYLYLAGEIDLLRNIFKATTIFPLLLLEGLVDWIIDIPYRLRKEEDVGTFSKLLIIILGVVSIVLYPVSFLLRVTRSLITALLSPVDAIKAAYNYNKIFGVVCALTLVAAYTAIIVFAAPAAAALFKAKVLLTALAVSKSVASAPVLAQIGAIVSHVTLPLMKLFGVAAPTVMTQAAAAIGGATAGTVITSKALQYGTEKVARKMTFFAAHRSEKKMGDVAQTKNNGADPAENSSEEYLSSNAAFV